MNSSPKRRRRAALRFVFASAVMLIGMSASLLAEIPGGLEGYKSRVLPFFKEHCLACHGPEKSKGKITLHSLDGDLASGGELERWERILEGDRRRPVRSSEPERCC